MGKRPPEDDLVDKLLDTIFTVSPDTEVLQTRDLTPFLKSQKYTDNVPVIRSYILQLLLQNKLENLLITQISCKILQQSKYQKTYSKIF